MTDSGLRAARPADGTAGAIASATMIAGARRPRIVYIQYTNPANYPPLEHSSRILAERGWDVLFLGAAPQETDGFELPSHPAIQMRMLPWARGRIVRRLNYARFVAGAIAACLSRRPSAVYASEPMAALPALIVQRLLRSKVIYHEHDSPSYAGRLSLLQRLFRSVRGRIARTADICILPQQRRLEAFVAGTGRQGDTLCVRNLPRIEEVVERRGPMAADRAIKFYFHGSINAQRLPESILDALAEASRTATLVVAGYETIGSQGYMRAFLDRAGRLGLGDRVRYLGPVARRSELLSAAAEADVGLAFMPLASDDINMQHMAGASNKPFDYLACAMMLLVSDIPEWCDMFVAPGYALACDPTDVASLAAAIRSCATHPEAVREMGELGRRRILAEWNYEREFAAVARELMAYAQPEAAIARTTSDPG